jgi:predicted enzyme involved in methoxymalonyl-ACP biosynthesis
VIGREVEERLLDRVEELARDEGISSIECSFVPAARNAVSAGFLPARGWSAVSVDTGPDVGEAIRYRKDLA